MVEQHRAVTDHLRNTERALRDLSRTQRQEILGELRDHVREAIPADASEADILNELERLGSPDEIATEARSRFEIEPGVASGFEVITLILLLVGGLVIPIVGWIIGVILLWISDFWTRKQKLLGTFVVPGGFLLPAFLFSFPVVAGTVSCETQEPMIQPDTVSIETCTSSMGSLLHMLIIGAAVLLPLYTAFYLGRRIARSRRSAGIPGALLPSVGGR